MYDHLFKLLLVGDSGVGKSSLLLRFTTDRFDPEQGSTIGVDFKLKLMDSAGKRLKLTIWDTAGQERFRTLTSSYYRGAHGIILVYDVTKPETLTSIDEWLKEVDLFATQGGVVKMLVGNKVDGRPRAGAPGTVDRETGAAFARERGMLFVETSAKTKFGVDQAFEELVGQILQSPAVVGAGASTTTSGNIHITESDSEYDEALCPC